MDLNRKHRIVYLGIFQIHILFFVQSMPSVAASKRQVWERSVKSFHSNDDKNTDERQIVSEEKAASPMLTSEALPVIGVPPVP